MANKIENPWKEARPLSSMEEYQLEQANELRAAKEAKRIELQAHYEDLIERIDSKKQDFVLLGVFVYRAMRAPQPHAEMRDAKEGHFGPHAYELLRNRIPEVMRDNHQVAVYSTTDCKKPETFAVMFSDWRAYLGPMPTATPTMDRGY